MSDIELHVPPGFISAALFIVLDIFTVGFLDIVLAKVVCSSYYRDINAGKPISVKSADIPGLSHYLLGRWTSRVNLLALGTKLALLAVVLVANISIESKSNEIIVTRVDATFTFDPSDATMREGIYNKVRRRYEGSKSCFVEQGDTLTYYPLRFNLQDEQLTGSDESDIAAEEDTIDVDDESVICMSPDFVEGGEPLMKVKGCTMVEEGNCLSVTSTYISKPAKGLETKEEDEYEREINHRFVDYTTEDVKRLWSNYSDPRLTCLTTRIGISGLEKATRYTHCLMVSVEPSRDETIVERWILGPEGSSGITEDIFILEYPGIIFEGLHPFGRLASARYLDLPFPFTDYRTLSGELIAQASQYKYDRVQVNKLRSGKNVTTMPFYAVGMVIAAMILVLLGFAATTVILWKDKRPRFNTINGLSSIVREEHEPSGRSDVLGDSATLGLHYTNADSMRFGPLGDGVEGARFQENFDLQ